MEHQVQTAPAKRRQERSQLAHQLQVDPMRRALEVRDLAHQREVAPLQQSIQAQQLTQDERLLPRRLRLEEKQLTDQELMEKLKWMDRGIRAGATTGRMIGGALGSVMNTFPVHTLPAQVLRGIGSMPPLLGPEPGYDYYDQLSDTLRMQESIQQVLNDDPILAERNSEELLPIIQTLVQVAPEVVSQPPALAAILRQATSGQLETLDPLTLSQLAEAEINLSKAKQLRERKIRGQDVVMRL